MDSSASIRLTVRDLFKIAGAVVAVLIFVATMSFQISGMKGDLRLQLQEIQAQLALQNSQINDRIDYIQGEIDADCFGQNRPSYRRKTKESSVMYAEPPPGTPSEPPLSDKSE